MSSVRALAAVALLWAAAQGAPLRAQDGAISAEAEAKPPRNTVIVIPIAYYTPETKMAGGIGGILAFRPVGAAASIRPSSVLFSAVYTQNSQFTIQAKPEVYLHGEDWSVTGTAEWSRFPTKFFGIGNDTPESAAETVTPIQILTEVLVQRRIVPGRRIYAGLIGVFETYRFRAFEPEGQLDSGRVAGSRGGPLSGLGLAAKIDTRDNVFFPHRGRFWQASMAFHGGLFGGRYIFSKLKTDLRSYLPLGNAVLGVQVKLESAAGDVPFITLPKMGSESLMRGYYTGRYRDRVLAGAQVEARVPLAGRFGAAVFGGLGEVASGLGALSVGGLKPSVGAGLRYRVTSEGNTLRLDFAWGRHSSGLYITAGEAF